MATDTTPPDDKIEGDAATREGADRREATVKGEAETRAAADASPTPPDDVVTDAFISMNGLYRYWLTRDWGHGDRLGIVMLNPSTADARQDDPTIRRCIGFAKREGFGGIYVVNLYALRATKPKHLLDTPDPEGPENVASFRALPHDVLLAYGAHFGMGGLAHSRAGDWVRDEARATHDVFCLGVTKDGYPRHPLYVRADAPFLRWPSLKERHDA